MEYGCDRSQRRRMKVPLCVQVRACSLFRFLFQTKVVCGFLLAMADANTIDGLTLDRSFKLGSFVFCTPSCR
jgi:hypothetical protein